MVLRLANLLVEGGFFSTVTVAFLVKGHTKNSCDRNFNAMKKIYHKRNIFTKDEVLKILGESEYITMIDTTLDFFNNLESLQDSIYYKYPNRTISKGHCFTVISNSPISVSIKSSATANELVIHNLKLGGKKY